MSSEISTNNVGPSFSSGSNLSSGAPDHDALQPWQLFTLAGLAGATAVVFVTRETGPAGVILLSLTVGAAAWMGLAAWRTLAPLFGLQVTRPTEVLGGRTRAALERDKALVLRAIRDLEFDRAMRKVSDKDFADMNARLRARAARILRELDRGTGYRDEIERELEKRLGVARVDASLKTRDYTTETPPVDAGLQTRVRTCACGTPNDPDARFCKTCGSKLEAA